jgi:hypothetical protein
MTTIIPTEIQQIAQNTYRTVRQKCVENSAVTVLHIADEYCFMAQGTNVDKPDNMWIFEIGTEKTAREFFIHHPPTAGEVENAIQVVEDEVMPLHKLLTPDSNLYTLDARILEIARVSAFEESEQGTILSIQDMEHAFTRLAAIISGRPASQDILPTTNAFAATLLILREVMHHLRFRNITIC